MNVPKSFPVMLFALVAITLFASPEPTAAQTVTVDLNKATLAWDWTKGAGGDVESFEVKCGRATAVYSATTPVADPLARSVNISQVINGSGRWFCVVAAVNRYGKSGVTNEVSFDAGVAPADPANLRVQAQ